MKKDEPSAENSMASEDMTPEQWAQIQLDQSVRDIQSRLRPVDPDHWTVKRDSEAHLRKMAGLWKRLAKRQGELLDEFETFTEVLLRDLEDKAAKEG